MKKIALALTCLSMMSCASHSPKNVVATAGATKTRLPSSSTLNSRVNLTDIVSLNSGYWNVKSKTSKEDYFGRYKAFVLFTTPDADYMTLKVFAEKDGLVQNPNITIKNKGKKPQLAAKNDDSKYVQIAENNQFVWGSDWGGTEPSLEVNGRGSLVIVTLNEGIGRSAWEQRVTVRLNPDNAKLEVIGYDYSSHDKLDLSAGSCSYNFSTGVGIIDRFGPEVDLSTGADEPPVIAHPTKSHKQIKVEKVKVDINNWKDASEMPVLKDCFEGV